MADSEPIITVDPTICCGEEDGTRCGEYFSRKQKAGLCASCYAVNVLKKEDFKDIPQCMSCGVKWKNLKGDKCGTCKKADEDLKAMPPPLPPRTPISTQPPAPIPAGESTGSNNMTPEDVFRAAMKAGKVAAARRSEQLFTEQRQAALSKGRMVQVYLHFYTDAAKPKPIMAIGPSMKLNGTVCTDAIAEKITEINAECWQKYTSGSIQDDDYHIRWPGGLRLRRGTEYATIGEVYDRHRHNVDCDESWFKLLGERKGGGSKKKERETMHLWVLMRIKKIELRDGALPADFVETVTKKRKANTADSQPTAKKSQVAPLVSTFMIDIGAEDIIKDSKDTGTGAEYEVVKLQFAKWMETVSGHGGMDWQGNDIRSAQLACKPFQSGASKLVYLLVIDGRKYVAKRYAVIPDGSSLSDLQDMDTDNILMTKNAIFLEQEIKVQKMGGYFLKEFYNAGRRANVTFVTDFIFTDCWLAREIVDETAIMDGPSKASGLTRTDYDFQRAANDDDTPSILWLIEPYHTVQTTKYSGTLSECGDKKLPFMTMQTLVYVDLQASSVFTNNRLWHVLFDTMTHTKIKGSTGPGDHGPEGLDNFVTNHPCNNICQALGIASETDNGEDDNDNDIEFEKVAPVRTTGQKWESRRKQNVLNGGSEEAQTISNDKEECTKS
ncbi:hypothetical protein E1B28_011892 [Marasmius oreades]|uniref:Alpha-type protein kinase domain-containing protein n=1 Tax=Marasmius oreades TaxID=181124 RepID=A0A9P7RVR8_9AGAR|nr:uncharacterized protein E1B28_011892 [Marasmius oreades]KAG7090295.1 hypothetical protein E1B28_011892 [Marasmius oreades]